MAILPHLLTGRRNVPHGPFWMGSAGFIVNGVAVTLIVFFNIFFCFPYAFPTTVSTMNYNSVILAGVFFLTTVWWFAWGVKRYPGPKIAELYLEGIEGEERVDKRDGVGSDVKA